MRFVHSISLWFSMIEKYDGSSYVGWGCGLEDGSWEVPSCTEIGSTAGLSLRSSKDHDTGVAAEMREHGFRTA